MWGILYRVKENSDKDNDCLNTEAEIETVAAFVFGSLVVILLFFLGHRIPFLFSPAICKDVTGANSEEANEVDCSESNADGVAIVIFRCVARF